MYGDIAMSLLDHPEAQALLADAEVSPDDVRGCRDHITRFLKRYLPLFYREEQRGHAGAFVRGLLSGLQRKSVEPIAAQASVPRKDLQFFVGCGVWDDEKVMTEMRRHVREELAEPDGMIVLDPSAFPKKGTHSCGVARQWCGRLGKKENCQLGVFLVYVSSKGHAPLDRRLYLPKDWVDDPVRREECHVPADVTYRKTWEIAHDLLRRSGPDAPHNWVVGDDEFGRASEFRAALREDGERYMLDVPRNTNIRDLDGRRPPRKKAHKGAKRKVPFVRVDTWARKLPADRWTRLTIRGGAKGPLEVEAVSARVCARMKRRIGPEERLLVMRTLDPQPDWTYSMSNASRDEPLIGLVRARAGRHQVEEVLQEGKGEVGLGHYEVRSWVGWHHHVTLALLALWFLVLERGRMGGKNPGGDGGTDAGGLHRIAPQASPDGAGNRRGSQSSLAA
jgi:SRSO17 transposase